MRAPRALLTLLTLSASTRDCLQRDPIHARPIKPTHARDRGVRSASPGGTILGLGFGAAMIGALVHGADLRAQVDAMRDETKGNAVPMGAGVPLVVAPFVHRGEYAGWFLDMEAAGERLAGAPQTRRLASETPTCAASCGPSRATAWSTSSAVDEDQDPYPVADEGQVKIGSDEPGRWVDGRQIW